MPYNHILFQELLWNRKKSIDLSRYNNNNPLIWGCLITKSGILYCILYYTFRCYFIRNYFAICRMAFQNDKVIINLIYTLVVIYYMLYHICYIPLRIIASCRKEALHIFISLFVERTKLIYERPICSHSRSAVIYGAAGVLFAHSSFVCVHKHVSGIEEMQDTAWPMKSRQCPSIREAPPPHITNIRTIY